MKVFYLINNKKEIPKKDIIRAVHLGKKPDRNRLIMVTRRHEDAKFLHNSKFERKIENEGKENMKIHPDLIRTEREAEIQEKKEKQKKHIKNKRTVSQKI